MCVCFSCLFSLFDFSLGRDSDFESAVDLVLLVLPLTRHFEQKLVEEAECGKTLEIGTHITVLLFL